MVLGSDVEGTVSSLLLVDMVMLLESIQRSGMKQTKDSQDIFAMLYDLGGLVVATSAYDVVQ